MRLSRVKSVHVGLICCFAFFTPECCFRCSVLFFQRKKIVGAGDIDLKIRKVLQNMQNEPFTRRKEQRVEVIEAQHDSTDDAMDTTLVQATLDV